MVMIIIVSTICIMTMRNQHAYRDECGSWHYWACINLCPALEYPLGQPVIKTVWRFQGVYLQPITIAVEGKHEMHHLAADKSDIHRKHIPRR